MQLQPFSCKSIRWTTPEGRTDASDKISMACPSFFNTLLGDIARRKLNRAWARDVLQLLDPVLNGGCVGSQHVGTGVHGHFFALRSIIFDDVRRTVEGEIHQSKIALIDLNEQAMRLL